MYDSPDSAQVALIVSLLFLALAVYVVVLLGSYALSAWLLSRVFRKAGIDRWKAWVPVYNTWVLLELGGQPGWLAFIALVPGASIISTVFICISVYHIDFGFGKPSAGWLVLYIFLPIVWIGILAFDSSHWDPRRMTISPRFGSNVPWPADGRA